MQKAIIIASENTALPGLDDLNNILESGWRVAHMATIDLPDGNSKNVSLGVLLILERQEENVAYHDLRAMNSSKKSNC